MIFAAKSRHIARRFNAAALRGGAQAKSHGWLLGAGSSMTLRREVLHTVEVSINDLLDKYQV